MKHSHGALNRELTSYVMRELYLSGVREYCFCPSARNSPFVVSLLENPDHFKVYSFFDERSAAFFALGRIRATQRPVAVVTTSGTAVGELMPAAMEARYAGLPLVLITADRPKAYRGTGAPQSCEQVGIFGLYAETCLDLESVPEGLREETKISKTGVTHLNLCYGEPLLESQGVQGENPYHQIGREMMELARSHSEPGLQGASARPEVDYSKKLEKFFTEAKNPLILVAALNPADRETVAQILLKWSCPVYLEGLSGLREDARLNSLRIQFPLNVVEDSKSLIDGVIRIGGVPTTRFWRDLEQKYLDLNVLNLSTLPYSGLARPATTVCLQDVYITILQSWAKSPLGDWVGDRVGDRVLFTSLIEKDRSRVHALRRILESEPTSEPGLMAALSRKIPKRSRIYLGNSLPIREWDLAATWDDQGFEVWGSRGLNGIDGQVSSFLGFAREGCGNWGVFGDLTALYDLQGPWVLPQLSGMNAQIIVINNGGGKIFSRMYTQTYMQNRHQTSFKGWADLWGMGYEKWTRVPEDLAVNQETHRLIEIVPDDAATERFWKQYDQMLARC